jgi:hypothetical protein
MTVDIENFPVFRQFFDCGRFHPSLETRIHCRNFGVSAGIAAIYFAGPNPARRSVRLRCCQCFPRMLKTEVPWNFSLAGALCGISCAHGV